ncbi:Phosphatidylinositol-4-phosphate 3-kinase C2 domain-containing gamma polypeptide [Aix galericulata]|nr:Phosphatidylinositol-4-phosphate 3-kinase C2 domain-containing gamma polypeptide [Aix galericulata]
MSVTGSAKPPAPETVPQEWMMLNTEKSIARATILGFNKKSDSLYLVQVVQTCNVVTFVEKSFDQFSKLHSHLQKQFPSEALPEFPHSRHIPFADLEHKRVKDLNLYLKQLLSGSIKMANNELVLSFFLNWTKKTFTETSSSVTLDGSTPSAHAEFYLLPDPYEVVYNKVMELKSHILKLVVKSKGTFVGAVNIQLSSVQLNEEKWYPLGNSVI